MLSLIDRSIGGLKGYWKDTCLTPYRYSPLKGGDEIRILRLCPTKKRIEIRVHHVSPHECSFQALSYVWGPPDEVARATVLDEDGVDIGSIPLTKSLYDALCDLRDAEAVSEKVFWVDQICINQQDKQEKGNQVSLMGNIYTSASRVITYLGPTENKEEEDAGCILLSRIYSSIPEDSFKNMWLVKGLWMVRIKMQEDSLHAGQIPSDLQLPTTETKIYRHYIHQGWRWLIKMAYHEWTRRLWIVQEQLLNSDVKFLCGHRLIDWDMLAIIPILFYCDHLPKTYRDQARVDVDIGTLSWDYIELTTWDKWWRRHSNKESFMEKSPNDLANLVLNMSWYERLLCEDPRDLVYALLSISSDTQALDIRPDYSATNTVEKLTKDVSRRILSTARKLELFNILLLWHSASSGLPSWCLRINDRGSKGETITRKRFHPHPITEKQPVARFAQDLDTLLVQGRVVDVVTKFTKDDEDATEIPFLISLLKEISNVSQDDLPSIVQTICGTGPWPMEFRSMSSESAVFLYIWAYFRDWMKYLSSAKGVSAGDRQVLIQRCLQACKKLEEFKPSSLQSIREHPALHSDDERAAARAIYGRVLETGRLFGRTRHGHFLNVGRDAQEGDVIVALQGADVLFVLRPVGDDYKLVTDAYVHGLMLGAAYEGINPDDVDHDIRIV